MTGASRKGWCPGALRPMAAKDGLLVRLRLTGGIVPAATARVLADCAERHGNGLFDLSARANLQMRGIGAAALPALQEALHALALLDEEAAGESVRNVIASPLAGTSIEAGALDIRPITAALEQRLAGDPALHALPSKFGFLIDDGGAPSLADVPADVRFDWDGRGFAIGLGGTRASAAVIGTCRADELVEKAASVASGALRLFAVSDARRMHQLVAILGAEVVARACGGAIRASPPRHDAEAPEVVGYRRFGQTPTLGLAAPFGRLDAAMLRHAADLAERGSGELRLTPWRAILLPGVADAAADRAALGRAHAAGFIVEDGDPRRAVAACVGMAGCERATTATRADAATLAPVAAGLAARGTTLHVSGCAKGCAKSSATAVTLVGREGRYDLVRDGRAGDPPLARGLDLAAARDMLAAMLEPA